MAPPPDEGQREACQDQPPDVMFPEDSLPVTDPAVEAAKQVCAGCPLREACLEAAMRRRERWGVWGGLTYREREALRRRRSRAAKRAREAAARRPVVTPLVIDGRPPVFGPQEALFEVSA